MIRKEIYVQMIMETLFERTVAFYFHFPGLGFLDKIRLNLWWQIVVFANTFQII